MNEAFPFIDYVATDTFQQPSLVMNTYHPLREKEQKRQKTYSTLLRYCYDSQRASSIYHSIV